MLGRRSPTYVFGPHFLPRLNGLADGADADSRPSSPAESVNRAFLSQAGGQSPYFTPLGPFDRGPFFLVRACEAEDKFAKNGAGDDRGRLQEHQPHPDRVLHLADRGGRLNISYLLFFNFRFNSFEFKSTSFLNRNLSWCPSRATATASSSTATPTSSTPPPSMEAQAGRTPGYVPGSPTRQTMIL